MLGGHSRCVCSPESHFKIDILRWLDGHVNSIDLTAVIRYLMKHWRFSIWELPLQIEKITQEASGDDYGDLLNWIVSQYAHHVDKPGADIWVDHTPENIGYALPLLELFPDAKFIHIVRDGRGVAASIMPLDWGPNSIVKAARWWMRMVSFGLAAESYLTSDQIIRIKYEDLVTRPEETLQQLCHFLEIPYEPAMKDATGFIAPSYTLRQHSRIGKSPDKRVASNWKSRLTPREVEIFEHLTRAFLPYMGYEMQYGLTAKSPTFFEIQRGKAQELFRGEIINKAKWLVRSYPLWFSRDFFTFAKLSDTNN